MKTLICFVILLIPALAIGQTATKIPIYVQCTCTSKVGMDYATSLRDAIASSPRYSLSSDPIANEKGDTNHQWILRIVSVPIGRDEDTIAISVSFTFGDIFISNLVQTCGSSKVSECAKSTLSSADDDITKITK